MEKIKKIHGNLTLSLISIPGSLLQDVLRVWVDLAQL
jgi:hypothetical protein